MKALIVSILLLITFVSIYYWVLNKEYRNSGNYKAAIYTLSREEQTLLFQKYLLKNIINVKDRNDVINLINLYSKDSLIVKLDSASESYVVFESGPDNHTEIIVFEDCRFNFDSTSKLTSLKSELHYWSSYDDSLALQYAPVYSYMLQSSDPLMFIMKGTNSLWLLYLLIFSILIIVSSIVFIIKKKMQSIFNIVIYLIFILLLNTFQLVFSNYYFINENLEPSIIVPSKNYFVFLGILSHNNALISDTNIIAVILLLICVFFYFNKSKKLHILNPPF